MLMLTSLPYSVSKILFLCLSVSNMEETDMFIKLTIKTSLTLNYIKSSMTPFYHPPFKKTISNSNIALLAVFLSFLKSYLYVFHSRLLFTKYSCYQLILLKYLDVENVLPINVTIFFLPIKKYFFESLERKN